MDNPTYVPVASSLDFSRLVCALEPAPRMSFVHRHLGHKVMSVQFDILGERPVIYYAPAAGDGRYLSYGIRRGKEEVRVVDSASDASKIYSPLIHVRSLPETMAPKEAHGGRYLRMELEDLDSLAKLSYDVEHSGYPLFLFPWKCGWLLGVFISFGDEDDDPYFCHVCLDEDPKKPFLRHSAQNGTRPSFVDSPDDHGYFYFKIIRLRETHPLVEHADLCN